MKYIHLIANLAAVVAHPLPKAQARVEAAVVIAVAADTVVVAPQAEEVVLLVVEVAEVVTKF